MDKATKGDKKDTAEFLEGIISEWRTVFDSITDMVSVLDTDHRFIRVNRSLADHLGVEPQEIIGKKCYEVMHGTDRPVSYCPIAKSTHIKKPVQKEVYDSTLNKYFLISLSPIMGENGKAQRIVHVMKDITVNKIPIVNPDKSTFCNLKLDIENKKIQTNANKYPLHKM